MKSMHHRRYTRPVTTALLILLLAPMTACQRDRTDEDANASATPITDAATTPESATGAMTPAGPATVEPPRKQVMEGMPTRVEMPPPTTETPQLPVGASIEYGCESGSTLRVAYGQRVAEVAWTDDRKLRLNAQPDDAGGGELYAGEGYQLRRLGSAVQLRQSGAGSEWRCMEANASA